MTSHDIMMVLVMSIPLILVSVWPGFVLGDFLYAKGLVSEGQKRFVVIVVMILFALLGASFVHFGI